MDSAVEYAAISFAGFFTDSCMLLQDNDAERSAPTLAGQFASARASDHAAANYADIIRLHSVEPSLAITGRPAMELWVNPYEERHVGFCRA